MKGSGIVLALVVLSGCQTQQKIATFAATDLTQAQVMATASSDKVSKPCFDALLPIAQKLSNPSSQPVGLFTAIQEARDITAAKAVLEVACGPLALDVMINVLKQAPAGMMLPTP